MNYTLDSVSHVTSILNELFPYKEVFQQPFFTNNLDDLKEFDEKLFYFGVFTNGENETKTHLNFLQKTSISMDANSILFLLFSDISSETENLKGQFRGFKLLLKNK